MNRLSFFLALILFIIMIPIFLIISVVILIDDGLPIIFKQKRIGKNGVLFYIYKFRTMKNETPNLATHLLGNKKGYYTKTGIVMRKYSLDELPQIFNMIKCEIKLIGPRPALYNQTDLFNLRKKRGLHLVSPGITGWAQVNGRDELSLRKKVSLEHFYLKNRSLRLDFKIIWLTILKVIKADGVEL